MGLSPDLAGALVEEAVCDRYDLVRRDDAPDWYDAETRAGRPVEIKGAKHRKKRGGRGGTTRRGTWWIQGENNDKLVQANGWYALAVYGDRYNGTRPDPERVDVSDIHLAATQLLPASFVSPMLGTWTETGDGHTGSAKSATRKTWTAVFEPADAEPPEAYTL